MRTNSFFKLEDEFLNANEDNFDLFLNKLSEIQGNKNKSQSPKVPIIDFNYDAELSKFALAFDGEDSEKVLDNF